VLSVPSQTAIQSPSQIQKTAASTRETFFDPLLLKTEQELKKEK